MPPAQLTSVRLLRQQRWLLGVIVAAILALAACQPSPDDETGDAGASPTTPPTTAAPTTTLSEREQVVARLREILKIRDQAIAERDELLLAPIYTQACPCRDRDQRLIRELKRQEIRWETAVTTVKPAKVDKESPQRWVVVGELHISPYRIERDSGQLIRKDPEFTDQVLFALEALQPGGQLLLADIRDLSG